MTETMVLRESVYITDVTKEELDEEQVVHNLTLIMKVNRHDILTTKPLPVLNLSKALTEFESAMTDFRSLMIFKHLCNSLELSAN